ncbi:hypothetical protein AB0M44_44695 [Streptosporangium subroseum]|uniref:hypothetical protein n=1 Tax=Streptosporangium subroseum TaxID=106412 RepID=UPI003449376C
MTPGRRFLLLGREEIALRERTLWRLPYESAARSSEILGLDVDELDLRNRWARVRREGGAADVIHSALTHAAEDGANTSTLLAYTGSSTKTGIWRSVLRW